LRDVRSLSAEILLVDHAILVDEKCHDTAGAIVRGKGDQAESASAWEHAVVVPVIGVRLPEMS
jgi:hypothetical protein